MLCTFCPAKSLVAAAPAVPWLSWPTSALAVASSSAGHPAGSNVSEPAAAVTAAAVALKPVRLKKNGSSRRPANTLVLPLALAMPVSALASPVTNSPAPAQQLTACAVSKPQTILVSVAGMP